MLISRTWKSIVRVEIQRLGQQSGRRTKVRLKGELDISRHLDKDFKTKIIEPDNKTLKILEEGEIGQKKWTYRMIKLHTIQTNRNTDLIT